MKLVKDARKAWRWFSVQAMAALALLPIIWMQLPPDAQAMVPDAWRPWIMVAVAIGGIAGRLIKQGDAE